MGVFKKKPEPVSWSGQVSGGEDKGSDGGCDHRGATVVVGVFWQRGRRYKSLACQRCRENWEEPA